MLAERMEEATGLKLRNKAFTLVIFALSGAYGQANPDQVPVRVRIGSQEKIDAGIRRNAVKNADRERTLKAMFEEDGCAGTQLVEQPVKHEKLPNVVCTLAGENSAQIIVGAHFDHVEEGKGVIDNWSGASLLPAFYAGLVAVQRKHTIVFVGFTDEEGGLRGSEFYAMQLSRDSLTSIRAMVNIDSVGLGPTKIWLTHSDPKLAQMFFGLAKSIQSPLGIMNADRVGDEDGTSFRTRNVPTIMIHAVTSDTFPVLHSSDDDFKSVQMKDYYETYKLTLVYLAYLDSALD